MVLNRARAAALARAAAAAAGLGDGDGGGGGSGSGAGGGLHAWVQPKEMVIGAEPTPLACPGLIADPAAHCASGTYWEETLLHVAMSGAGNAPFPPVFYSDKRSFAMTGSGQTQATIKQKELLSQASAPLASGERRATTRNGPTSGCRTC